MTTAMRHDGHSLRVVTYNVRRCLGIDGMLSVERIAETIRQCDADVVALQELDVRRKRSGLIDQAREIARLIGAPNVYFHPAMRVFEELYGDALLTRLPARLVKAGALPQGPWRRSEPRGAIWAWVEWQGRRVQVVNTHLGIGSRERRAQIDCLLGPQWLSHPDCAGPLVFLGDLNSLPRGRVHRSIAAHFTDAQCANGVRPRPTFPARFPVLRIDHVFANDGIRVKGAQVWDTPLARIASDHRPLVVDLQLAGTGPVSRHGRSSGTREPIEVPLRRY